MSIKSEKYHSTSTLFSNFCRLLIHASLLTGGLYINMISIENANASLLIPAENANLGNSTSLALASTSRPEFLGKYPAGTVLCFNDRSVENKVRIVDFNQSFQVVDFVYLDGGYQGQKGSAGYSTFVYNSYPCSY
ncbi:hypothetical protein IQ255_09830 [Pleurocapsales cyanobacterium LEGE 10410]|nr:hypothetical protein [Pleurocapsales cyanobacterium LEGE 10410]